MGTHYYVQRYDAQAFEVQFAPVWKRRDEDELRERVSLIVGAAGPVAALDEKALGAALFAEWCLDGADPPLWVGKYEPLGRLAELAAGWDDRVGALIRQWEAFPAAFLGRRVGREDDGLPCARVLSRRKLVQLWGHARHRDPSLRPVPAAGYEAARGDVFRDGGPDQEVRRVRALLGYAGWVVENTGDSLVHFVEELEPLVRSPADGRSRKVPVRRGPPPARRGAPAADVELDALLPRLERRDRKALDEVARCFLTVDQLERILLSYPGSLGARLPVLARRLTEPGAIGRLAELLDPAELPEVDPFALGLEDARLANHRVVRVDAEPSARTLEVRSQAGDATRVCRFEGVVATNATLAPGDRLVELRDLRGVAPAELPAEPWFDAHRPSVLAGDLRLVELVRTGSTPFQVVAARHAVVEADPREADAAGDARDAFASR